MAVRTGLEPATSCVTGRHSNQAELPDQLFKKRMEEVEGFEPPRAFTPLSVFKTDPFSRTWVYLLVMVEPSGIEPLTSCVQGRRSPS